MVTVFVYSKGDLIGSANLDKTDPPMGCAGGVFHPNESYLKIQHEIRQHHLHDGTLGPIDNEKLKVIEDKIEAFELVVKTETDEILDPVAGIHFVDFSKELEEDPIQLDLLGLDHEVFNRHFPGEYERYEKSFSQR